MSPLLGLWSKMRGACFTAVLDILLIVMLVPVHHFIGRGESCVSTPDLERLCEDEALTLN